MTRTRDRREAGNISPEHPIDAHAVFADDVIAAFGSWRATPKGDQVHIRLGLAIQA